MPGQVRYDKILWRFNGDMDGLSNAMHNDVDISTGYQMDSKIILPHYQMESAFMLLEIE